MEMRFCEWLESIRKEGCYSIRHLSAFTGIPQSTIGSNLRGDKFPKIKTFIKYMAAFGVPYIWDSPPSHKKNEYLRIYDAFLDAEDKYNNFYKENEVDEVL